MDALTLRAATAEDADALWALLGPTFRAGDTYAIEPDVCRAAALAYWQGAPNRVFLAEGPAPLGTYYLRPNQRGPGAHVCNAGFVTGRQARGRGVARAMLDHALATAREAGFAAMQFNFVVATNAAALHLWKSAGFEEVGSLPRAFRHPTEGDVDALVLYRFL